LVQAVIAPSWRFAAATACTAVKKILLTREFGFDGKEPLSRQATVARPSHVLDNIGDDHRMTPQL
jgi:hypothetical protein